MTRFHRPCVGGMLGILALLALLPVCAQAADFRIDRARASIQQGVLQMDADIRYHLPKLAIKALHNGIPIGLLLRIELRKPDWIGETVVVDLNQQYRIRYDLFDQTYTVSVVNSAVQRVFDDLSAALNWVGRVRSLPVIDQALLRRDTSYSLHIKTELDFDVLPISLRMKAYLTPAWYASSDWYLWSLR